MRKTTFAAVLIFFGLVGATVWTVNRDTNRGIHYVTLSDIATDTADRIELTGPRALVLEKKNDAWYLDNGRLADIAQVRNLLKSAEHVQSSDVLTEDPARYAEYGVDDPNGTYVRVLGGGHELAAVTVGRGLSGGMALRKGNAAYKVNGIFPNAFVHDANEWMERRLFVTAENEDVTRVEVALRGEPAYALVHNDTSWQVAAVHGTAPFAEFRTDAQAAQRLVHEIVHARAEALLERDPGTAVTGLDKPVDRLTLVLLPKAGRAEGDKGAAEGVRTTLLIGAEGANKSRYVRVEGTQDVALIAGYAGVQLRKSRESLRDMRLSAPADLQKVAAMEIRRGPQKLRLIRKDGAWSLPGGASANLDSALAQRRAGDVVNARAMSLALGVTARQAGIDPREGEAKLILNDKTVVNLVFGRKAAGNQVYVRGTADGKVYLVNAALRDHLLGMLDTLRKRPEGDPLARFDQQGIENLPPDVRAGLSEHFAQKKREQQALQLMKGRKRP